MKKSIKKIIAFAFAFMLFNIATVNCYASAISLSFLKEEGQGNTNTDTKKQDGKKTETNQKTKDMNKEKKNKDADMQKQNNNQNENNQKDMKKEDNKQKDINQKDTTKDKCDKDNAEQNASKDIVEVANSDNRLKTFSAAVKSTGLDEVLKDPGQMTVFAPSDEAFKKLPKKTLDDLSKPENKEKFEKIIAYHIAPGNLTSAELAKLDGQKLKMHNSVNSNIEVKSGVVYINGAKVVVTDITAKNGIIHIIDAVILPPS